MFGGFTSPQNFSNLTGVLKGSPHTHGFGGGGNVRFNEELTVHHFSPTDSALGPTSPSMRQTTGVEWMHLDSPLRPADLGSAIKPGLTPILPEERSTSFSKWCSSRRSRLNESEDLRRKSVRSISGSSLGSANAGKGSPGMGGIAFQDSRSGLDSRRNSLGQWSGAGSPAKGLHRSLSLSTNTVDRWWLDKPDGAADYCDKILSESATRVLFTDARIRVLAPQINQQLPPPAALLEQTAHGVRRWIGCHVLGHVITLMAQVEQDAAKGFHKPAAPKAAAPGPAPGTFGVPAAGGFGGGAFGAPAAGGAVGAPAGGAFGALPPANAQQQQQQQQQQQAAADKARKEELEEMVRANALDRKEQVCTTVFLH
jgi:hypothetical protein